jgi:hypothetical protein
MPHRRSAQNYFWEHWDSNWQAKVGQRQPKDTFAANQPMAVPPARYNTCGRAILFFTRLLRNRRAADWSNPYPGACALCAEPTLFYKGNLPMFGNDKASDDKLQKAVDQRLMRGGAGSQSRITARVSQGNVTVTGNLQYEAQRSPLVKNIARVAGVRRVIDQLKIAPKVDQQTYARKPAAPVEQPTPAEVASPEASAETPPDAAISAI